MSVVVVVLVLLEIPLGVLTARHERSLLSSQAVEEAAGLAIAAAENLQHGGSEGLVSLVDRYHAVGGSEVLVVYGSGSQVVDSDGDPDADRAEIHSQLAAASAGRTTTGAVTDEDRPFVVAVVPFRPEGPTDAEQSKVTGAVALLLPAAATIQRIRDAWLILAAFGVIMLLLTAIVGARLASSLSRPLAALERSVALLGAGELSIRAEPQGPADLRALATQFNDMAKRLQRLVSAQTQFVADASHQLRSPLAALRLRLENMESRSDGPMLDSLVAANLEVQRLSRLLDGLLTLSRADEERPQRMPINVLEVVAERVEAWSALAEERDVDLGCDVAGSQAHVVDLVPGDLEQILDNFLANAFEATPSERSITVELSDSEDGVDVVVRDQGIGMAASDRKRAFDRFWQGPNVATGSSGLGLAIVRQIAGRNAATVELLPAVDGLGGASGAGVAAVVHLTL
jgi:signal transduction histidine kinase